MNQLHHSKCQSIRDIDQLVFLLQLHQKRDEILDYATKDSLKKF